MAQAQETLDCILLRDVSPIAEKILKERIAEDIYAAYTPAYYKRRHVLEQNVESDLTSAGTLFVTSTANAAPSIVPGYSFENRYPGAFLEMLEVGNMGFWRKHFPRPAVAMAQGVIDKSAEIKRAITDGIRREFRAE
ncbi:MAG: hypothetical protein FWF60_09325 [Oscillospiraceae bacterium]|nr:hypothetical protein [Oscillospiraceae bacterium]